MNTQIQSSASWTDTLKARKNHLTALLKIVDIKTGKATTVQKLTVDLIKAEINHVDSKLYGRK
ncbi:MULTISPECIES: hypothetical protein [Gammaproteobacteria]|uniref:hypothetical protein n=1 Tax=Gammaproteobacteria TaxID=1236 RepID=UPI001911E087|nr:MULTISPECIES: hypothetical protein [Gammaproteobacteria]MBK5300512.1 hypothetical protein [Bacillus sp. TH86]MBK5320281.1 hypothetical protein [Bacillus sp. TH59]MBK5335231.1 hypothetical protein [Bacillus sp. TH57]MBK5309319.1 hypothetical protein [Pseudomonas sp. TH71]MBK5314780.1 hypothetical protein [Erwinia sp. TH79]